MSSGTGGWAMLASLLPDNAVLWYRKVVVVGTGGQGHVGGKQDEPASSPMELNVVLLLLLLLLLVGVCGIRSNPS